MLAAGNPPDLVRDAGTDVTPYIASQGLALNLDAYFEQSTVLKTPTSCRSTTRGSGTARSRARVRATASPRTGPRTRCGGTTPKCGRTPALRRARRTPPSATTSCWTPRRRCPKASGGKTSMFGLWYVTPDIDRIAADGGDRRREDHLRRPHHRRLLLARGQAGAALDRVRGQAGPRLFGRQPARGPGRAGGFAGKQATACQGYWFTGFTESTAPAFESKLQFNAAPLLGSTRISPTFGAVGYWIPAKAKNPGASFAWMEYYCGGAIAKQRISAGDGLPSLHSMLPLLPQRNAFEKTLVATQNTELNYINRAGRLALRAEHRDQHDPRQGLPQGHLRWDVGRASSPTCSPPTSTPSSRPAEKALGK